MANGALQVISLMLCIMCFILIILTCVMPFWRRNDLEGEVLESIRRSSGLWTKCTYLSTGNWNCDAYDRFFIGLPAALQAARALTILALLFNLTAVCTAIVGLDCTTVASDQPQLKHRCTINTIADRQYNRSNLTWYIYPMIMLAGVQIVVSGLCIGIAVSWFAANVLYDYHNPLSQAPYVGNGQRGSYSMYNGGGDRYVYGECLFLGWVAMILSLLTGIIFCCNSYNAMQDDPEEPYTAGYNPPLQYAHPKSMGHEYI